LIRLTQNTATSAIATHIVMVLSAPAVWQTSWGEIHSESMVSLALWQSACTVSVLKATAGATLVWIICQLAGRTHTSSSAVTIMLVVLGFPMLKCEVDATPRTLPAERRGCSRSMLGCSAVWEMRLPCQKLPPEET
jgi:hypothetical protein